jgi:hypothetical protein
MRGEEFAWRDATEQCKTNAGWGGTEFSFNKGDWIFSTWPPAMVRRIFSVREMGVGEREENDYTGLAI